MSSRMSPSEIVLRFFEGTRYLVPGKSYHSALPEDLRDWYCYTIDGGHSILSLIEGSFNEGAEDLLDDLCPCPVKAVLRKEKYLTAHL